MQPPREMSISQKALFSALLNQKAATGGRAAIVTAVPSPRAVRRRWRCGGVLAGSSDPRRKKWSRSSGWGVDGAPSSFPELLTPTVTARVAGPQSYTNSNSRCRWPPGDETNENAAACEVGGVVPSRWDDGDFGLGFRPVRTGQGLLVRKEPLTRTHSSSSNRPTDDHLSVGSRG